MGPPPLVQRLLTVRGIKVLRQLHALAFLLRLNGCRSRRCAGAAADHSPQSREEGGSAGLARQLQWQVRMHAAAARHMPARAGRHLLWLGHPRPAPTIHGCRTIEHHASLLLRRARSHRPSAPAAQCATVHFRGRWSVCNARPPARHAWDTCHVAGRGAAGTDRRSANGCHDGCDNTTHTPINPPLLSGADAPARTRNDRLRPSAGPHKQTPVAATHVCVVYGDRDSSAAAPDSFRH